MRYTAYFIRTRNYAAQTIRNIQTDVIVMDFAKAFDKVPHKRLLYKLDYYGIRNNTLLWIQDFLSLRSQTVLLEGYILTESQLHPGVPSGYSLGAGPRKEPRPAPYAHICVKWRNSINICCAMWRNPQNQ